MFWITQKHLLSMPHAHSLLDEPTVSVVVPYYGIDFSALIKCVGSLLDRDSSQDRITIFVIDNNEIASLPAQCLGGAASYFTSLYQVPMPLEIEV
jgi:hypothetical protein